MDKIFHLLNNYNLHFISTVADGLKCVICCKILVDACLSPCGCKFCFKCIKEYLGSETKMCPGNKDECYEGPLSMELNIMKDPSRNIEISYMTVRCPFLNCDHQCWLRKLPNHLAICVKALTKCVFSAVGCANNVMAIEDMKSHLEISTETHAYLLISYVRNIHSEMELRMTELSANLVKLRNAIDSICTDVQVLNASQETYATVEHLKTITKKANDNFRKRWNDVVVLKDRLDDCDRRRSEDFDRKILGQKKLNAKEYKITKEIDEIKAQIRAMQETQRDFATSIQMIRNNAKVVDNHNEPELKLGQMEQSLLPFVRNVPDASVECLNECAVISPEMAALIRQGWMESEESQLLKTEYTGKFGSSVFEWLIKSVSGKQVVNKSEPFFSDGPGEGYKMRMVYATSKQRNFYLVFKLMLGPNDDTLKWPMLRTVQIDILDQKSLKPVLSRSCSRVTVSERKNAYEWAYDQPRSSENCWGDGFTYYLSYYQVEDIPGAVTNNSILARCRVLP